LTEAELPSHLNLLKILNKPFLTSEAQETNTMEDKELIKKIVDLEKERRSCDSKSRENEIKDELNKLPANKFDGKLVKLGEKFGRIWHSYYGTYKLYFNSKWDYKWTGNYCNVGLDEIEFIEEDNEKLVEDIYNIELKIYNIELKIESLKKEINKLEKEKREVIGDFVLHIDPSTFEETKEINRSAFSMSGETVYISEAFCLITGERVTS
jgi:hypothetical protein